MKLSKKIKQRYEKLESRIISPSQQLAESKATRDQPIRTQNFYLRSTPEKRADPIRSVGNLRVPYRLTKSLVQVR